MLLPIVCKPAAALRPNDLIMAADMMNSEFTVCRVASQTPDTWHGEWYVATDKVSLPLLVDDIVMVIKQ